MESCVHHHQGSPSSVPPPHSTHDHPLMDGRAEQDVPGSGSDISYQNVASAPTSALVEMLNRIDALEAIPRLQVEDQNNVTLEQESTASPVTQQVSSPPSVPVGLSSSTLPLENSSAVEPAQAQVNQATVVTSNNLTPVTSELPAVVSTITILPQSSPPEMTDAEVKRSKVGRPRTKPQKEKTEWHQHLGGVRHCRVPLTPELREVLEVAYVSKIMSKNFRKEGQPEKERIARITGMDIDKVQEWFKNRRKKDKLLKERTQPKKRGRPSTSTSSSTSTAAATPAKKAKSAEMGYHSSLVHKLISQSPHHHQGLVEIDAQSLLSQIPQQTIIDEATHLTSSLSPTAGHMLAASDGSGQVNLQSSTSSNSMDTVAGHELQVASSIELTM